jgi:hypothetical protein
MHVHQFDLMWYIHEALFTVLVEKHGSKNAEPFSSDTDKDQRLDLLGQLEDATICVGFDRIGKLSGFLLWLFEIWEVSYISALLFHLPKLRYRFIMENFY